MLKYYVLLLSIYSLTIYFYYEKISKHLSQKQLPSNFINE